LRVLCAEDFPTNQIIIRTLLEDSGHEVEVVDNGRLALQALHERRFDLVLMDGRMPEMDGSTATRWIRAGGQPDAPIAERDIPIVALTANASEEDRQHYLACGMDDFIAKPINEDALHDTLARVITTLRARGHALAAPRSAPTVADLDALFGLAAQAPSVPSTPHAAASNGTPPHQAQRQERLRQAYAQDLPERIASLEQALNARDAETASLLLHGLKGSTGFLAREGRAHALCSAFEVSTLRGDWQRLDAEWPELRAALTDLASPR
jgi:CheY-like chemotaxis protein